MRPYALNAYHTWPTGDLATRNKPIRISKYMPFKATRNPYTFDTLHQIFVFVSSLANFFESSMSSTTTFCKIECWINSTNVNNITAYKKNAYFVRNTTYCFQFSNLVIISTRKWKIPNKINVSFLNF